ncbi:MAG: hypothetical protein ACYDH2_13795 [Anaerolineaceae bacterium]
MSPQEVVSNELGFQAEALFLKFFQNLQYAEVLQSTSIQPSKPIAIVKTSQNVDEQEGIDFYLFHHLVGWVRVDISLDTNPDRMSRKREKERTRHIFVVVLNLGVLDRATRGCYCDIQEIADRLQELFLEAKQDSAYVIPTFSI